MCLIAVCRKRGITEEEAKNAFEKNDDGVGIAWYSNKKTHYVKGIMDFDAFKEIYFNTGIKDIANHVVHFRKASMAGDIPALTHPFIISETSDISLKYSGNNDLLFHNGTMTGWRDKMFNFYITRKNRIPEGNFSDTRFIAILTHFLGRGVLHLIDDKFVVMSGNRVYIIGKFTEEDGVLFSNSSYKTGGYSYQQGNEHFYDCF